ncbi:MAG TPA: hypothetical protein VNR90_12035 [Vicinamibacterales bacterium]|nr:hypothetical protein [Vicinamibacterales bacterium]
MSTPPTWPPPPPPTPPQVPPGLPGDAPLYAPAPKKSSAVPIVVILIVVIFGGLFVIGIIAAIAIPSLLRARTVGNETAALGALRTMASAQVAWASRHDGHFVQPDCLAEPPACGDAESTSLLPIDVALLHPRSGYDFGFVLRAGADDAATNDAVATDAPAAAAEEAPGVSPPGSPSDAEVRAQLEQFSTPDTGAAAPVRPSQTPNGWPPRPPDRGGFVYWASPSNPGVTGRLRFCIDETGLVRAYPPGTAWTAPSADRPHCPEPGRLSQQTP